MTKPLTRPKRKNPVLISRVPTLPPMARSRVAHGLTAAAAIGRLELQTCRKCHMVQYPPRDVCQACLSEKLEWRQQNGGGVLLSITAVNYGQEIYFRTRAPWHIGIVQLDCGPRVIAHLHGDCTNSGQRVRIRACLDRAGQGVLMALPEKDTKNMKDDPQLREMTCDPKFRKVLVTDSKSNVGQEIVKAIVAAGADVVWAGYAEPWKKLPGFDELKSIPEVTLIPMDLTNSGMVRETASLIGGKVDILINNAEYHRAFSISQRRGLENSRAEMDINYFGLLRLAQEFGPVMRSRAADGQSSAVAWVNLLSVYALSNFPAHGTFSASKAAAYSLSQCLRAEMLQSGIRVINVFPGPIDDEFNQTIQPPKITPSALAKSIVNALLTGVEDIYPGAVAQEWFERWRNNAKALERKLAQ